MDLPAPGATLHVESSSILDVRAWFEKTPWRMAAAWSMLAAVLAVNSPADFSTIDLQALVLLLLLVDPLWGSLWGLMVGRAHLPRLGGPTAPSRIWLPYLHSGSPAARLFGKDGPGLLSLLFRVALPSILLSVLVASTLDPVLLWLTGLVLICSLGGWLHREVALVPLLLLHSLVTVALPWLAVLYQFGGTGGPQGWTYQWLLVGLWTLHSWGSNRSLQKPFDRLSLAVLALAQLGISLLLIVAQAPLWLALLSVLWLPTWLTVYQRRPLNGVQFWWLVAMLVSALALGQR